ncbi:hypothetical protein IHE45_19G002400 [Dioscorea alata]|uniref:Uncharacterized protein n=2 Tax=Dioscorea alata TaxID=55571 RepID=A0ACB7TTZ1_DIOAL|nr:hypothetical protein IHE45_19G002400 [Dioscorea alata]KAH7652219.1 hypothetical protein IHE45_19G002400 [Dioscorea alata]
MAFNSSNQAIIMEPDVASGQSHSQLLKEIELWKEELLRKRIDLVEKTCEQRIELLLQNQLEEVTEFCRYRETERVKLQKAHDMDLDRMQALRIDTYVKINKMNLLHEKFLVKLDAFDRHMKGQRRKLIVKQLDARAKEGRLRDHWLEDVKAGRLSETFDELALSGTGFFLERFKYGESDGVGDEGPGSKLLDSGLSLGKQSADKVSTGSAECADICGSYTKASINSTNESAAEAPTEPGTAAVLAIATNTTKCDASHRTETLLPSFVVIDAAVHKCDAFISNSEAVTEAGIAVEAKSSHSELSGISNLLKEFDAIPSRLVTPPPVDKPDEMGTSLLSSCVMNKADSRHDSVVFSSQGTDGVCIPVVNNILQLDGINAASDEVEEIQPKLMAKARVDNPLETQTPSSPIIRSSAVNELDIITNTEANSGVGKVLDNVTLSSSSNKEKVVSCDYEPTPAKQGVASGVGSPVECESPSLSTVRDATVNGVDASVTNLELTNIVGIPRQEKILRLSDATNVAADQPNAVNIELGPAAEFDGELDNVVTDLEATNRVRVPLVTKSLHPSDATNAAANIPDKTIDSILEPTARMETTFGAETPPASDAMFAAAGRFDAINTSSAWRQLNNLQYQCVYSDSAFLASLPLQSQIEVPSSSQVWPSFTLENPMASNQALDASDQECGINNRPVVDQELSPLPSCFQQNHPTPNETEHGDNQTSAAEQGPYQIGLSNQDISEPNIASLSQFEPSNQPFSQAPVQPMSPPANIPRERMQSQDVGSISSVSGNLLNELQAQLRMHPQCLQSNPFDNELTKISKLNEVLSQMHEDKKQKIKLECEKDLESVKRKYEALIQEAEQNFVQGKKVFQTISERVNNNIILAAQFRDKFYESKGRTPATSCGATMTQQIPQVWQQPAIPRPSSPLTSAPAPARAGLPSMPAGSPQLAMRHQDAAFPHQMLQYTHPIFPGNSDRSNFSMALPSQPPIRHIGRDIRLPAPHLQSSRYRPSLLTPSPTPGLQTGSSMGRESSCTSMGLGDNIL